MRRVVTLLLGVVLGTPAVAGAAPGTQVLPGVGTVAHRPEGRPSLLLTYGRSLDGYLERYGMRRTPASVRRGTPEWLSAIEKTRLDARRIWSAPSLSLEEKLERLVGVVQHRFPGDEAGRNRHERMSRAELGPQGDGFARLDRRAARRAGTSFERAWLLRGLLAEVGQHATVRSGEVYDMLDRARGPRSWVEVTIDGQRHLVDPSSNQPLPETRSVLVNSMRPSGRRSQVAATETLSGWLYLPSGR